jgi:nucleoside phosphorylase/CheY-like chemotaxis protein
MLILIVEDNREKLQEVVSLVVGGCGVSRDDIHVAQSGIAARSSLSHHRFDLLILDILLPLRDEDMDAPARTALDLITDIHTGKIAHAPRRIIGLTGHDTLPKDVLASFREYAWLIVKYDVGDKSWHAPVRNSIAFIRNERADTDPPRYLTDLCVVTALPSPEFEQMLRLNWNWGDEKPLDDHVFITKGSFQSGGRDMSVAMCCAPRMGMVATSLLASRMIDQLRPRFIAMTGICAGIQDKVGIGDVLMAETSWNWQSGKHAIDTLGPYFAAAPHPLDTPEFIRVRAKALAKDAYKMLEIKRAFAGPKPSTELSLRVGPVASGSSVIADADIVKEIQLHERTLIGIEMEVYGLYAAASYACKPKPTAFAMKAVCDFGTRIKNDEYQAYAAHTSAQVFGTFCERYFHEMVDLAGS